MSKNQIDLVQIPNKDNYLTTILNIFVNLGYPYSFFQINMPMYAEISDTGINIGKINFHKSCSNIITLSNVIRSIPKKALNIFTDHGK